MQQAASQQSTRRVLGSPDLTAPEPRKPEVSVQMGRIHQEIVEIERFTDSIEAKFASLLQPPPVSDEQKNGAAPYYCNLGGELGTFVDRLQAVRGRMLSMLDRAEI